MKILCKSYKILGYVVLGPVALLASGSLLEMTTLRFNSRLLTQSLQLIYTTHRWFIYNWSIINTDNIVLLEDFNSETFISGWSPFRLELPLNKKSLCSALQCQAFRQDFRHWPNKKLKKKKPCNFQKTFYGFHLFFLLGLVVIQQRGTLFLFFCTPGIGCHIHSAWYIPCSTVFKLHTSQLLFILKLSMF